MLVFDDSSTSVRKVKGEIKMNKHSRKVLLSIMALLCMVVLFQCAPIKSKATDAPGTLVDGLHFGETLKQLSSGENQEYYEINRVLRHIVFTKTQPSTSLSQKDIGVNVKAYFDKATGTAYIYCPTKIIFNKDCAGMFYNMCSLESIDFNQTTIDTSNTIEMDTMFHNCEILYSINLSQFRTGNVTSMFSMFSGCAYLKSLDLSNFDTSKAKKLDYMFFGCTGLKSLNLSSFNTANAEDMEFMFHRCTALKSLDLSNFNTSNAKYMTSMFAECSSLQSLNISSFDTSNVSRIDYMFYDCSSLETLDLSSFDLSYADRENQTEHVFGGCNSLKFIYSPKVLVKPLAYDYYSGNWSYDSKPVGKMALDDNNNGIPDNATFYEKLPIATVSHKYLLVNKLADPTIIDPDPESPVVNYTNEAEAVIDPKRKDVTINGITYTFDNDSNATVIKIGDIKKASIDKITVSEVTYPVVAIADGACTNNNTITALTIGPNVKSIGQDAFKGCKKLKKVTIKANKSLVIGKDAFKKLHKKAVIKVKGLKGKARKKIVKAIKKQTKATVK